MQDKVYSSDHAHIINRSPHDSYLVAADFLESPVDVEKGHVVALAGDEFLAHGEDVIPASGRIVKNRVHREQRDDGQNLFGAAEVRRDQERLQIHTRAQIKHLLLSLQSQKYKHKGETHFSTMCVKRNVCLEKCDRFCKLS